MVERKLFKTKLCILYQRGNCPRESCSFAHGDAELRRGSFNDRRDYQGNDLRNRLGKGHSPRRRYSPQREAKGRHAFHGYSPSQSPEKRSERRSKKRQQLDGQSDVSGSLKISDGTEGVKEKKITSSGAKIILEEELKQVQLDIDVLEDRKSQREVFLEGKVQEAVGLRSRNIELEDQLSNELDDCRRLTSKIKKFVKAHTRYSRAKDELKRAQARLQKLDDELSFDASRVNDNEEDSSVNIVSDEELNGHNATDAQPSHTSLSKKRPRTNIRVHEAKTTGNTSIIGATVVEKLPQSSAPVRQFENNYKEADGVCKTVSRSNGHRSESKDDGNKRRKSDIPSSALIEKVKVLEPGHGVPSTGMAAHAVDELIEVIEMEKIEDVDTCTTSFEEGATQDKTRMLHLPPPPPAPPRNAYKQYEGEEENVDVEELDLERVADVNDEVDIEQL